MYAEKYNWTPQEVDAMDPTFIEELSAFWSAQSAVKAREEKRAALRKGAK